MKTYLVWPISLLAACSATADDIVIAETPRHTTFAYLPASLKKVRGPNGELRQVTIVTRNRAASEASSGGQVGARSEMEFDCVARASRQLRTLSIRSDGSEVEVISAGPKRPMTEARSGSFERKIIDAICGANL